MNILVIVQRIVKELLRDKRTLALLLFAPLLMLTLLHFVFEANLNPKLKIGITQQVPQTFVAALPEKELSIQYYSTYTSPKKLLKKEHLAAYIDYNQQNFKIYYQNDQPNNTKRLNLLFRQALQTQSANQQLTKPASLNVQKVKIKNFYLYGNQQTTFFDHIFPLLIGFFVFFFVFLISGIALLKERSSGTLDRMLATSIRRSEIILGYLLGYGLFAIIQTIFIVFYAIYLLKVSGQFSILLVILINIFTAFCALAFGLFISTFANSEFQMMQFIPIVIIPQLLFSGIIPLESMHESIQLLAKFLPLSYTGDALSQIMIKNGHLKEIHFDLLMLLVFTLTFTYLNIIGLKRYRKV